MSLTTKGVKGSVTREQVEDLREKLNNASFMQTDEESMGRAQAKLAYLLAAGEMRACEARLKKMMANNETDMAFIKVLSINIDAAKERGWVVKQRVLTRIFELVQAELERTSGIKSARDEEEKSKRERQHQEDMLAQASAQASAPAATSRVGGQSHAPRFMGDFSDPADEESGSEDEEGGGVRQHYWCANGVEGKFLDCTDLTRLLGYDFGATNASGNSSSNSSSSSSSKSSKKRKKARNVRQRLGTKVDALAEGLQHNGFAVCDGLFSEVHAAGVREECKLLQPHFEASEIWVGKEAGVGAQIAVPSVRGDSVLWMCGGHQQGNTNNANFDSAGLQPKSRGSVEPCNPRIKGSLPLRRFSALRDLLAALDALVLQHLKTRVTRLGGVAERSDAMLSEYRDGARFQRHVDNTAQDGRVLTCVVYFNAGWEPKQGGQLRLYPAPGSAAAAADANAPASGGGSAAAAAAAAASPDSPPPPPVTEEKKESGERGGGVVRVLPLAGRVAFFWAEEMPHEVTPSHGERFAMTVWYYDEKQRQDALDKADAEAKAAAGGGGVEGDGSGKVASVEAQAEATAFMKQMTGDDDATMGLQSRLRALAAKAETLSRPALTIVAAITGAPGPDDVVEAMQHMTPQNLEQIRRQFRRMGLND